MTMARISIRPILERLGLVDENSEKLHALQEQERLHAERPTRRSWFARSSSHDDELERLQAEQERLQEQLQEQERQETESRETDFTRRAERFGWDMVKGSLAMPYEREVLTQLYRQALIDDHRDGTSVRLNLIAQTFGARPPHNLCRDQVASSEAAKTWFQNHPA